MQEGFTIFSLLKRAITIASDKEIVDPFSNVRQTYRETYERVIGISNSMLSIGITKGSVIGVADYNTLKFVELLFASSLIGAIIYPINVRLPYEQLLHTINHARVEWIFTAKDFAPLFKNFNKDRIISLDSPDTKITYDDLVNKRSVKEPDVNVKGSDPYSILFTSGTTGLPKAVIYTNEKTVHGALGMVHQLSLYNSPAPLKSDDVILGLIPFYHLWSWGSLFHATYLGAKYVTSGKFEPMKILEIIEKERISWLNAVPTMIFMLLSVAKQGQLKGLKALVGGSPISSNLAKMLKENGVSFASIYGGTDMLAISITIFPNNNIQNPEEYARLYTHPLPFVELKIIKPDGEEAKKGEVGELWIKTPWLPGEYLNDPENTRSSYVNDWFRTGDVAMITESNELRILDREKDLIKSGGEWIIPSIIESLISEVSGVDMVAVIGRKNEKWGERPVAIVKGKGQNLREDIINHLKDSVDKGLLPKWWIPDEIIVMEDLPLTSTGKVNKRVLRDRIK
ncbi:AMP-binding protein [Sulfolobus sp. E11-6]|uniref:AMP-binding protein n=1 Tax=Sulfolobus sp. E11-6 TaxID=2663020 RepID=UPI0012962403|nr:AMP-binding protein [Sulfolobus sp. E11-6]QGA69094.1 AMP-binding protein [Sulfolobus sp. E11-6]